ncbi:MAG: hypothetical protein LBR22_10300 [Desulfovibrio sp.]|jgi:hypothetical protein|nr:hypothetical protein [Desulfovibrio sp.]
MSIMFRLLAVCCAIFGVVGNVRAEGDCRRCESGDEAALRRDAGAGGFISTTTGQPGGMGTWVDPATGDIITSVTAPPANPGDAKSHGDVFVVPLPPPPHHARPPRGDDGVSTGGLGLGPWESRNAGPHGGAVSDPASPHFVGAQKGETPPPDFVGASRGGTGVSAGTARGSGIHGGTRTSGAGGGR